MNFTHISWEIFVNLLKFSLMALSYFLAKIHIKDRKELTAVGIIKLIGEILIGAAILPLVFIKRIDNPDFYILFFIILIPAIAGMIKGMDIIHQRKNKIKQNDY